REQNNVEGIRRLETRNEVLENLLRSVERKPVHRTGNIEHKNVLARRNLLRRNAFGRLHGKQEEVLPRAFVNKKPTLNLLTRQFVVQNEVLVSRAVFQQDMRDRRGFALDAGLVRRRSKICQRDSRGDVYPNGKGGSRRLAFVKVGALHELVGLGGRSF